MMTPNHPYSVSHPHDHFQGMEMLIIITILAQKVNFIHAMKLLRDNENMHPSLINLIMEIDTSQKKFHSKETPLCSKYNLCLPKCD